MKEQKKSKYKHYFKQCFGCKYVLKFIQNKTSVVVYNMDTVLIMGLIHVLL